MTWQDLGVFFKAPTLLIFFLSFSQRHERDQYRKILNALYAAGEEEQGRAAVGDIQEASEWLLEQRHFIANLVASAPPQQQSQPGTGLPVREEETLASPDLTLHVLQDVQREQKSTLQQHPAADDKRTDEEEARNGGRGREGRRQRQEERKQREEDHTVSIVGGISGGGITGIEITNYGQWYELEEPPAKRQRMSPSE